MKRFYRQLTVNILIALLVFVVSLDIHNGNFMDELHTNGLAALIYYGIHFSISLINKKYEDGIRHSLIDLSRLYSFSWLYSAVISLLILVTFQIDYLSREIILINIFGLFAGESVLVFIITIFRESISLQDPEEIAAVKPGEIDLLYPALKTTELTDKEKWEIISIPGENQECFEYALNYFTIPSETTQILNTSDQSVILSFPVGKYNQIINFRKLNRIPDINKFIGAINSRLPLEGLMMVCAETSNQRKTRILQKYPLAINRLVLLSDYFFMRMIPKIPVLKNIFFALTNGQNRVMSRPEILGRLIASGFEIVTEKKTCKCFLVICRKVKLPASHIYATYGPLIHLLRVGQGGKMIKIYKLRTMHPYSEFIQEYVYDQHNLALGGKIKDDFRVTLPGKFLRRFWIDELPSLYNWLRGDVKLFGVRPLSRHYFNLYTPELQQKRIRYKPGLIPPFYADLPKTLPEIMDSELRYLELYEKAPLKTDFNYFWKAIYNILFKGAKSY
jgi:lipopolysaccharide/colanic/teichoic acid biosynthesis glycosyltransferase